MTHYFLNIGTNLGNRKLNLSRALRALETAFGWFEASSTVETRPWGYVSDNEFLNIGVMVVSEKPPREVLETIKGIECDLGSGAHRDALGGYCDRLIDIDIVAADGSVIKEEGLEIPHPRLAERRFFLEPMAELAPLWRHPATGKTCGEMLAELKEG